MKLRVYIVCADCGGRQEVHVLGGWDIKTVQHDCPKRPRFVDPGKPDGWKVEFEPRRAFA